MAVQDGDVLEVSARSEFDGIDDVVNVFQFTKPTGGGLDNNLAVDDIIEALEIIYTILNAFIVAIQLYRDVRVANLTQDEVLGTHPWDTLAAGTNVNDALPPGVAALSNFHTTAPKVSPRKYWGVFGENNVESDGRWASGVITQLAAVNARLLLPFAMTNGTWWYGYDSPKTGTFMFPVSGISTDIPAYQRRRKQGRGA